MKRIMFFLFNCLNIFVVDASAQTTVFDSVIGIHKVVMKHIKQPNTKYVVASNTNKYYLQQFNFQDPSGINNDKGMIWNDADWKKFLLHIDTSSVLDYSLVVNGKPLFKKPDKIDRYQTVTFSSVIISPDKNKALSIFRKVGNDGSGSYIAAYLQRTNGKWYVCHMQTFAYLD